MKIINICLAKKCGGLEQMAINYHKILDKHISIFYNDSWISKKINDKNIIFIDKWYNILKLINNEKTLFICHDKRSLYYLNILKYFNYPIVTCIVNHNQYKIKKTLNSDYSVIITKNMLQFYPKNYNLNKVFILNNFSFLNKKDEINILNKNIKNIGFIGRLVECKGCLQMIKQLKKYLIKNDIILNIYGDGTEKDNICEYIKNYNLNLKIVIHGWIKDVRKCYLKNDVIIVPSYNDTFPVVIIDAFSYGCPTIVSDKVLINNDIIKNMENTLIYNINDYNDLEQKIMILNNDFELKKKISLNSIKTYNKKLSNNMAKKKINTIVKKIITSNKKLKILYINDGIHFNLGYNFMKLFNDSNIEIIEVKIKMLVPCLSKKILEFIIKFPSLYFFICIFYDIQYPNKFDTPNLIYSHGGKTSFLNIYFSNLYNCDNFYTSSLRNLNNTYFTKIFTLQDLDYDNHFKLETFPSYIEHEITKQNNLWLFAFGGSDNIHKYKEKDIVFYCNLINNFSYKYNIKWLILTSRRTSKKYENIIKNTVKKNFIKDIILFNSNDKRSIKKFYSICEAVFVTIESTSMIGESINLIKPVILLEPSVIINNLSSIFIEKIIKPRNKLIDKYNLKKIKYNNFNLEYIFNYIKKFKGYKDPQIELKNFLKKYIEKKIEMNSKISKIKNISFYVLTHNSEKIIDKTLNSIKDIVDEIIVVDSGSNDNTIKICQKYTNKIYHFEFDSFTKSRKYAESKCIYDWIIYLDSDEVLTTELIEEIKSIKINFDTTSYDAISFYWKPIMWFENKPNLFSKKKKVIRIYNKKKCTYSDHPFHDLPVVKQNRIYQTKNYYEHFVSNSLNHCYFKMINRNIKPWVIKRNRQYNLIFIFLKFLTIFQLSFLKALFIKRFVIYGLIGLKLSLIYAYSRFLRVYITLQDILF